LETLVKGFRVLDRERMEFEAVAQDLEIRDFGAIQVEPKELVAREETLDHFATEVDPAAVILADYVPLRR
jgi:hypothetical protein